MPKIMYKDKNFRNDSLIIIDHANDIIRDYQAQGYELTLRQVYYQFVARDLFPEDRRWEWTGSKWKRNINGTKNADPNYKWLGTVINDARLAGLVDWDALVDRTRFLRERTHWDSPSDIVRAAMKGYHIDMWRNQDNYVEVWVEKDALIDVVKTACEPLDVPCFSCRGYVSQSEMWNASQRLCDKDDKDITIIHLGDHDPSGIDMTRDIDDRLHLFGADLYVDRIALTMDQVRAQNPPPNPAKLTDTRCQGYIREYGDQSWELDALEPSYLTKLITGAILDLRDEAAWDVAEQEKQVGLKKLEDALSGLLD